jgi:hypothetical protein
LSLSGAVKAPFFLSASFSSVLLLLRSDAVRWLLSFLLIFLYPLPGQTAFEFLDTGARPVAMGGAFCAVADDAHAPHYNPAGMVQVRRRKVTFSTGRFFGLADVTLHSVYLLQPSRWGILGLGAQRFGGGLYRESTLSLSFARPLRKNLFLGLSLRGLQLAISGYGVDRTLGLDLGFLAAMTSSLRWGLLARNLNNGRLGSGREQIPRGLIMGFAFRPYAGLLLSADLRPDLSPISEGTLNLVRYPISLRLGQEFCLWPSLTLRLGLQTRPTRYSMGMGVGAGPFQLDYCHRSHQFLGGSHHISLSSP